MDIIEKLDYKSDLSLALGFFDGIHIAHKKIIQNAVKLAFENNTKSALITFKNSPSSFVLKKEPFYITTFEKKAKLIEREGIDYLYVLDFGEFVNMKAKTYIEEVLIKHFSPKFITTGFNHTFGLNREGCPRMLHKYKSFKYTEIQPVLIEDIIVSSTNIKNFIKNGEIELANKMLTRNFSVSGKVIKGNQIARKLGYKTANLLWRQDIIKPSYGVYAGFANFCGEKYPAMINFGVRPSVDKELKETLEVHIVGYSGNLYDEITEVEFLKKIRNEIKFNSLEELKNQIDKDYVLIRNLL